MLAYQDSALTDQDIKFADPDREVEDQDDDFLVQERIKTLSSQIRTVLNRCLNQNMALTERTLG